MIKLQIFNSTALDTKSAELGYCFCVPTIVPCFHVLRHVSVVLFASLRHALSIARSATELLEHNLGWFCFRIVMLLIDLCLCSLCKAWLVFPWCSDFPRYLYTEGIYLRVPS